MLRRLLRRALTVLRQEGEGSCGPGGAAAGPGGGPGLTAPNPTGPNPTGPGLGELPSAPVEETLAHFGLTCPPERVRRVLVEEERRFDSALERGRRVLARPRFSGPLGEPENHDPHIYTHGLPRDLVEPLRGPDTGRGPDRGPAQGDPGAVSRPVDERTTTS